MRRKDRMNLMGINNLTFNTAKTSFILISFVIFVPILIFYRISLILSYNPSNILKWTKQLKEIADFNAKPVVHHHSIVTSDIPSTTSKWSMARMLSPYDKPTLCWLEEWQLFVYWKIKLTYTFISIVNRNYFFFISGANK